VYNGYFGILKLWIEYFLGGENCWKSYSWIIRRSCTIIRRNILVTVCQSILEDIVTNLTHCNTLILKLKAEVLPNQIIFLLESQLIIENIKTNSEIFLKNVKLVSHNISQSECSINTQNQEILNQIIALHMIQAIEFL